MEYGTSKTHDKNDTIHCYIIYKCDRNIDKHRCVSEKYSHIVYRRISI